MNKFYQFLQDVYLVGRAGYDKICTQPTDYSAQTRQITLIEFIPKTSIVAKHDITVAIQPQFTDHDIHDFIRKIRLDLQDGAEYFVEFEFNCAGETYKYLTEYQIPKQESEPKVIFPIYDSDDVQNFHQEYVPNGVILSTFNDDHDITDELHQHAGPKGNFYSDLDDHHGFKLEWVRFFDDVPKELEEDLLNVEILTYHGHTFIFSNDTHIKI